MHHVPMFTRWPAGAMVRLSAGGRRTDGGGRTRGGEVIIIREVLHYSVVWSFAGSPVRHEAHKDEWREMTKDAALSRWSPVGHPTTKTL